MLTSTGGLRAALFQKKEMQMFNTTRNVIKEFVFENEVYNLKVMVEEYVMPHRCNRPVIKRFLVSLVDYTTRQIKQHFYDDFSEAVYAAERYCVEAEHILEDHAE